MYLTAPSEPADEISHQHTFGIRFVIKMAPYYTLLDHYTETGFAVSDIFSDWSTNRGDIRIQLALLLFRTARRIRTSRVPIAKLFGRPFCFLYLVIVEWTWGIELPWATSVGPGLRIYHGTGIVVNGNTRIGKDVTLRQGVCIGARTATGPSPTIADGVQIGAGAIVLGGVNIGANANIGAGAVVLADVPAAAIAVGNPARVIT